MFIQNKPMVYSEYGGALLRPNLWFSRRKPVVYSEKSHFVVKTNHRNGENRAFLWSKRHIYS